MESNGRRMKSKEASTERKLKRFSRIENEKDVPFFKFYNPQPDPVLKQEHRKLKLIEFPIKKPKTGIKCSTFKDKKEKQIEKEEIKLTKYTAPLRPWQIKENALRHNKEKAKYFVCKKELIRLPSPLDTTTIKETDKEKKMDYKSAEKVQQKLIPEKWSMTESTLKWPPGPTYEQLIEKIPRSRIFINKKKKKGVPKFPPVDSFNYIYDEKYRKQHHWYTMYRGDDHVSVGEFPDPVPVPSLVNEDLEVEESEVKEITQYTTQDRLDEYKQMEQMEDMEEELSEQQPNVSLPHMKARESKLKHYSENYVQIIEEEEEEEDEEEDEEDENGKQNSEEKIKQEMKVEIQSAATSVDSQYGIKYPSDEQLDNISFVPDVVNKILQKYHTESDVQVATKESKQIQRHTINSHSSSKLVKLPAKFYFGVKLGTMHYGDPTFSERSRYRQGLPMAISAYIFSFIKKPSIWTGEDINKILDLGDKLYLKSLEKLHMHTTPKVLNPEEICDVLEIGEKKIKYKIDDPDIAGFTRSDDSTIFNLEKGLMLFFNRSKSGILQTYNTNILIWKQKHYYVFDPEPRTQELYYSEKGTSILANLYDIESVASMLLNRGKIENWPFIISKISITKATCKDEIDDAVSIASEFREESLYKIVDINKAVICGSLSILDNCFGDCKNKQALAISCVALIYNHVTPACAWHKRTVDKILMVGNQFHIECLRDTSLIELKIENLPAFFTIGPLMIEISIYANQIVGLMFKKNVCYFQEQLDQCFTINTAAIIEIDRFTISAWKTRDVYYCFDPYNRDREGHICKNGTACVTMNTNVECLAKSIVHNFNVKEFIFKIHILKVVKINRDPEYGKAPRSFRESEESIIESIKVSDKRAFIPKNIGIDRTEFAMKTTELDQILDPSIIEMGSFIGSLDKKFVPKLENCPTQVREIIEHCQDNIIKIVDLDSPSLSDTQIPKDQPRPMKETSFCYKAIDEIYREQQELERLKDQPEGDYDLEYLQLLNGYAQGDAEQIQKILDAEIEVKDEIIQKGRDIDLMEKATIKMNTDLFGLVAMPLIELELQLPPKKSQKHRPKTQERLAEEEVEISQITELKKVSNFVQLPDGSEVMYGTKNIANLGDNFEFASPFVSSIALVMERKYTLNTWTKEVIDSVLDYGFAVYSTVATNIHEVPKIIIPRIAIGSNSFSVVIDYLFDSLLSQSILEKCLEKLVFAERSSAIIVTQDYSCAILLKKTLYYMFDGFGCNLVGLGEGPDNTGVACMFRFKTLRALTNRFLYNKKKREMVEPTEASRFVISTVDIKVILPPEVEKIPRREKQLPNIKMMESVSFETNPKEVEEKNELKEKAKTVEKNMKNKVGYQKKNKVSVIEGTNVLEGRNEGVGEIKSCHFISVCAMIGLFGTTVNDWDTKRVDYIVRCGLNLFSYVDNPNFADSRNIDNLLIDRYFFDFIIKRIIIADERSVKNFKLALNHMLIKYKFLLIQLPNACYMLYHGANDFHLFDAYGVSEDPKSCWIQFLDVNKVITYIKRNHKQEMDTFLFYSIKVSKIKKASKRSRLEFKLRVTDVKVAIKNKKYRIFHEDEDWLSVYPIPWSRMKRQLACGKVRGRKDVLWFNWDVEYPQDLYSLTSSIHQTSPEFSRKSRGKQTMANCIVAIVMTEIYNFTEWNTDIMDSIIRNGDQYFNECFSSKNDKNYEIKIDDFNLNILVFPYTVKLDIFPLIEGTMYIVRPKQFNLSKALRYFFESYENRTGLICCSNGTRTKYLAFGRIREEEYFMFDCATIGPPMFVERHSSKAYILRCLTLNRLIHIMTVTLRSGDFFIYYIGLSEEQDEEQIQNITSLSDEKPQSVESDRRKQEAESIAEKVTADPSPGEASPDQNEPEQAEFDAMEGEASEQ